MAISSSVRLHLPPSSRRPAASTNLQLLHAATAATCRWPCLPVVAAPLRLRATDDSARQPFDHESHAAVEEEGEDDEEDQRQRLKIAIVGFGKYGQFLGRTLVRQGHIVLAHSRSDHSTATATLGASLFPDPHDLCECHPDVVLLATSILFAEAVLCSLPVHRLRRDTLSADVPSAGLDPLEASRDGAPVPAGVTT